MQKQDKNGWSIKSYRTKNKKYKIVVDMSQQIKWKASRMNLEEV